MALRDQPYLPLYVQDFLTDEKLIECSAEATGVYIRLMCIMHKSDDYGTVLLKQKDKQTDKPIENFAYKLSRQMPFDPEVISRSLTQLLDENVLTLEGDILYQKRMIHDNEISEKRSESGRKGGKSKAKKDDEFASSFAKAKMLANTQANTENESESENPNNLTLEDRGVGEETLILDPPFDPAAAFDRFWSAYPNKVKKKDARLKFKSKVKTQKIFDEILADLEVRKQSKGWLKDGGEYIPHPTTYLNQERWEDEQITEPHELTATEIGALLDEQDRNRKSD